MRTQKKLGFGFGYGFWFFMGLWVWVWVSNPNPYPKPNFFEFSCMVYSKYIYKSSNTDLLDFGVI